MTSRSVRAAAVLAVSLLMACSPSESEDPPSASQTPTHRDSPSSTSSEIGGCRQLDAAVPDDLVDRSEHVAEGVPFPVSVGVIWSNSDGTRVVNVSSAASDEEFGDGANAEPIDREVQGTVGVEIVVNGVHKIVWQPTAATPPCTYWIVVAQGLSPDELDDTLSSVRESGTA